MVNIFINLRGGWKKPINYNDSSYLKLGYTHPQYFWSWVLDPWHIYWPRWLPLNCFFRMFTPNPWGKMNFTQLILTNIASSFFSGWGWWKTTTNQPVALVHAIFPFAFKALMFVNVSMCLGHLPETLSSLRFASKVKNRDWNLSRIVFWWLAVCWGKQVFFVWHSRWWLNTKDMFQYLGCVRKYH